MNTVCYEQKNEYTYEYILRSYQLTIVDKKMGSTQLMAKRENFGGRNDL